MLSTAQSAVSRKLRAHRALHNLRLRTLAVHAVHITVEATIQGSSPAVVIHIIVDHAPTHQLALQALEEAVTHHALRTSTLNTNVVASLRPTKKVVTVKLYQKSAQAL